MSESIDDTKDQEECVICLSLFTETSEASPGTEECDHAMCAQCVRQYFTNALRENRYTSYELIQCPSPGCIEFYYSKEAIESFFTSDEAKKWWDSALTSKAYFANKVNHRQVL